jgi:hypothetical protein
MNNVASPYKGQTSCTNDFFDPFTLEDLISMTNPFSCSADACCFREKAAD